MRRLAAGREVVLVSDSSADDTDRYGRRLGYLEVEGLDAVG